MLAAFLGITDFVNADVIARGLSGFDPRAVDIQAGRVMLTRIRELAAEGRDFAFETTLASRSFAPWIAELRKEQGYRFVLNYVWVPDPSISVRRVESRVRAGGHHVASEAVRRRYAAGLRNFFDLYQPISDSWKVFDNSKAGANPHVVAEGVGVDTHAVYDPVLWEHFRHQWSR